MIKKEYIKPSVEVTKVNATNILAASTIDPSSFKIIDDEVDDPGPDPEPSGWGTQW